MDVENISQESATAFNLAPRARERVHQKSWAEARGVLTLSTGEGGTRGWVLRGWPDKLTPGMIAVLQAPGDTQRQGIVSNALLQECVNETIQRVAPSRLRVKDGQFYMATVIPPGLVDKVLPEDVQNAYRIPASAVVEWFRDTDTKPSFHVAGWFSAMGIEEKICPPIAAPNTETHGMPLDTKPWNVRDPRDPEPSQPWYTPARHFARQLVIEDSTLLSKKLVLADKVSQSLAAAGIFKRGGVKKHAADTVLKAFVNVALG